MHRAVEQFLKGVHSGLRKLEMEDIGKGRKPSFSQRNSQVRARWIAYSVNLISTHERLADLIYRLRIREFGLDKFANSIPGDSSLCERRKNNFISNQRYDLFGAT